MRINQKKIWLILKIQFQLILNHLIHLKKEIKRENDFKEIDINKFVLDLKDEGTLKSTKSKLIDLYDNIMKAKDLNIIHEEI